MLIASAVNCPSCGAPLPMREGQRHAICVFCNTSSMIHQSSPEQAPELKPQDVSHEDIERLTQLVLVGKRDQAIELYAAKAQVTSAEARAAVNDLLVWDYARLTKSLPINWLGFAFYFVTIGAGLTLASYGLQRALARDRQFALAILIGVAFAVWRVVRMVPHVTATWVNAYGAEGRALVQRIAVLRTTSDSVLAQVGFEVTPVDGSARFADEEILLLHPESHEKLVPGAVIRVRFDEPRRSRVFPFSPIEVVAKPGARD